MRGVVAGLAVLLVLGLFFFRFAAEPPSATDTPSTAEMTEAQIAQIEAEVMAFEESKLPAFTALDADRLVGLWTDGNISSVSFAERIVGAEAMQAFYQQLVASWAETRLEWLPGSTVDVLAPDLALFQGTARQATTNQDGFSYVQNVHFTDLLKKVDGEWRIQRNHVSGGVVTDE